MKIHNQLEEVVVDTVNEIFDEEAQTGQTGYCTCDQCRLDVACYVLNRSRPRYTLSGRGVAHLNFDYQERLQEKADLVALIRAGIETVSRTKRPNFSHDDARTESPRPSGPLYNFPVIKGRVFHGSTFEPVNGVEVLLTSEGTPVKMIDARWQNPYPLVENVAGLYVFWPYPVAAQKDGETNSFSFAVELRDTAYEPLIHHFTMKLTATDSYVDSPHGNLYHRVEDLYLFPSPDE